MKKSPKNNSNKNKYSAKSEDLFKLPAVDRKVQKQIGKGKTIKPKEVFQIFLPIAAVLLFLIFYPRTVDNSVQNSIGSSPGLSVHFIDVGQGDSELIIAPDGEVMLIDCGPNTAEDKLIEYLNLLSVDRIDYLVLTHPHEDHIGGADRVISELDVKNVIMPDVTTTTTTFKKLLNAISDSSSKLLTAKVGDIYSLGDASFKILGPVSITEDDLNNCSIVLRLQYGKTSFLFTGDAEAVSEKEILNEFSTDDLKSDVLKVGHHGSSTSSSEEFLLAVMPKAGVISCEKNNKFGHPHFEIINRLEENGVTYFRTDKLGTVVFYSDGETISTKK